MVCTAEPSAIVPKVPSAGPPSAGRLLYVVPPSLHEPVTGTTETVSVVPAPLCVLVFTLSAADFSTVPAGAAGRSKRR